MTASDVATATPQAQDGKSCPNSKEASPVKVRTPAEVQEEATTCLVTGKRHLMVSDIPAAVTIWLRPVSSSQNSSEKLRRNAQNPTSTMGRLCWSFQGSSLGCLETLLTGCQKKMTKQTIQRLKIPKR